MDPVLIELPERIVSERLVMRCPRAGDGAAMAEAVAESIDELRPWMPWAQQVPTADEQEAMARSAYARFMLRSDLVYALWLHDGQGRETRLVGGSGLHRIDWSVPRFEIGYWRRSGCGGQGYVTEAVNVLTRLAFDTLKAARVEIRMDDDNAASWRVAERAGYTLEGTLRRESRKPDGRLRDTRVYARVQAG